MTVSQIIDKVKNETYANTDEFLLDFKWLYHIINIFADHSDGKIFMKFTCIFRFSCTNLFSDDHNDLKNLKKEVKCMLNESIAEVDEIRSCCDCYFNRDRPHSVTMVCSKPHLVLWVQYGETFGEKIILNQCINVHFLSIGGHPWWPAKLLKVGNGDNPLEVQFFGEFSSALVTYTDCYLFSNEDPNVWCSDTKKQFFNEAMKVSC